MFWFSQYKQTSVYIDTKYFNFIFHRIKLYVSKASVEGPGKHFLTCLLGLRESSTSNCNLLYKQFENWIRKIRRVVIEYCSEQVVGLELDPTIFVRQNITFVPATSLQLKNR